MVQGRPERRALLSAEARSVDAFLDALNAHSLHGLREVLSADFVFEEVAGAGEPSIAALETEITTVFVAFPDILFRPVRQTTDGDRTYVEFRAFGTHENVFLGVPATRAPVIVSGVLNLRHSQWEVDRLRLTLDFGGLRRQLLMAARVVSP
jgi:hypothetical protein